MREPDDGRGHDDGGDDGDRLRRPRRALTWLVLLVALGCGWQVLPERLVRLHGFTADQHARSAEAAPLPNRGERWIVDMERMALAWLEPGDRVAVWSAQSADRIPTNQFDRMRLGYLMAPEPLWRSEDIDPGEVDWVYSSRTVSLAMEQAGWTGFEQVETPRAHRLYRRPGGRADGRETRTETESGLPDGGPPLGVQVAGVMAAMAAAWLAGWLVLLSWAGAASRAARFAPSGGWRRPFVALLTGQLLVAAVMLAVNAAGWAGNRWGVIGLVALVVLLLAATGLARARWRDRRGGVPEGGAEPGRDLAAVCATGGGSIGRAEGWWLGAWTLLLLVAGGWAAVSWHTNCLPGMGIWAHKAKLFHLAGGFPEGYFSTPGWSASQPGYPLLPALLMQWGYVCTGAVADRAVGVWNALWLAAACAWVMAWLRAARAPAAAVWLVVPLLFLSGELVRHWFERYAEPLFLLHAVTGLGLVAGALGAAGTAGALRRGGPVSWRRSGGRRDGDEAGLLAGDVAGGAARPAAAAALAANRPAAVADGMAGSGAGRGSGDARLAQGMGMGMLLVATSAWVKHEGLLITLAAGALLLLWPVSLPGWRRRGVGGSRGGVWSSNTAPGACVAGPERGPGQGLAVSRGRMGSGCRWLRRGVALAGWVLLAASWLLASRWLGAQAGGYDWARPLDVPWEETRQRLEAAGRGWRQFALNDGAQRAGVWWLAPLLMAWSLAACGGRRTAGAGGARPAGMNPAPGLHWLTLVACGYAVGLGCVYVFSTQPFPWVMTASQSRGLMLPTVVLAMALLASLAAPTARSGANNRRLAPTDDRDGQSGSASGSAPTGDDKMRPDTHPNPDQPKQKAYEKM